jgi:hypothetical protein
MPHIAQISLFSSPRQYTARTARLQDHIRLRSPLKRSIVTNLSHDL